MFFFSGIPHIRQDRPRKQSPETGQRSLDPKTWQVKECPARNPPQTFKVKYAKAGPSLASSEPAPTKPTAQ